MTLGAQDKKKLGFLVVLGLFAAYMVYSNLLSGPDAPRQPSQAGAPAASNAADEGPLSQPAAPRAAQSRSRREEFHPVLHSKRPEDRIDPRTIDPTLRLDLLAKVQGVELAGGSRNLFQFSTPPPPKPVELPKGTEPKILPKQLVSVAAPVGPPQPPPPPPITFKYLRLLHRPRKWDERPPSFWMATRSSRPRRRRSEAAVQGSAHRPELGAGGRYRFQAAAIAAAGEESQS